MSLMHRVSKMLLLCVLLLMPISGVLAEGPTPAVTPQEQSAAIDSAIAWLSTQIQPNGGLSNGFGGDLTSRAIIAVAAVGRDARTMRASAGDLSLIDYARGHASQHTNVGQVGRWAAALAMAGENPFGVGGANLSDEIMAYYDPASGSFDVYGNVWNQCYAIWGLVSTMTPVPEAASAWLDAQQNADGGWGWAAGQPSDSNSAALVLQTLASLGRDTEDQGIAAALDYLQTVQNDDGGFLNDPRYGLDSDADSTGAVLQALAALGSSATSDWDWARAVTSTAGVTVTVNTPLSYLYARQLPSGAFEWQPGFGANTMTTLSAVPAMAAQPIPFVSETMQAAQLAVAWLQTQQQADGSFNGGFGDPASATLDVLMAGLAAGQPADQWQTGPAAPTTIEYLASQADRFASDAGKTGKLLTAVVQAGADPSAFGGINLVARLQGYLDAQGSFGSSATEQAWGIIASAAAGLPVSAQMLADLGGYQQADGGWESGPGWGTDSNTTSIALQAMAACYVAPQQLVLDNALTYLQAQRGDTGGFAYSSAWGLAPDANSTALGIQGLLALSQNLADPTWEYEGKGPMAVLLAHQLAQGADSGAFEWKAGEGANLLATAQAVPALLKSTFPLRRIHTAATFLPIVWDTSVSVAR